MKRSAASTVIGGVRMRAAAIIAALLAASAPAQLIRETPLPETEGVGIVERRGAVIPPDIEFRDWKGRQVRIGDLLDKQRPLILVLAYYDCPLLCTLTLNALKEAINDVDLNLGPDYRILTVSFDHTDTTSMAASKKAMYALGYNREAPEDAWVFATSEPEQVKRLAEVVGYHYRFLPETGEFSHPSALIFVSPDGMVSGYLEHIKFKPRDVKMALMEAGQGKIGSVFDKVVFTCFMYDPKTGQYVIHPMNVMRIVGGATAVGLGVAIAGLVITNRVRARRKAGISERTPTPLGAVGMGGAA
jgi:protein SCO1/2